MSVTNNSNLNPTAQGHEPIDGTHAGVGQSGHTVCSSRHSDYQSQREQKQRQAPDHSPFAKLLDAEEHRCSSSENEADPTSQKGYALELPEDLHHLISGPGSLNLPGGPLVQRRRSSPGELGSVIHPMSPAREEARVSSQTELDDFENFINTLPTQTKVSLPSGLNNQHASNQDLGRCAGRISSHKVFSTPPSHLFSPNVSTTRHAEAMQKDLAELQNSLATFKFGAQIDYSSPKESNNAGPTSSVSSTLSPRSTASSVWHSESTHGGSRSNTPKVVSSALGTPTAELGPFEYPMQPSHKSQPSGFSDGSPWVPTSELGLHNQTSPLFPLQRHGGSIKDVVAAGPGIGALRRMSTIQPLATAPRATGDQGQFSSDTGCEPMEPNTEMRRPSVVHSNSTLPLISDPASIHHESPDHNVHGLDTPFSRRRSSPSEMPSRESGQAAFQRRLSEKISLRRESLRPIPSAAALGTLQLLHATSTARRQSIHGLGQIELKETPIPPTLLARRKTIARKGDGTLISGLTCGADKTSPRSAGRSASRAMPSLPPSADGPSRPTQKLVTVPADSSAFARVSFSPHAGPVTLEPETSREHTMVSSAYLYHRGQQADEPYS